MAKVLLLKGIDRTREVETLLQGAGYEVTVSSSVVQARGLLLDVDFSLVVIESPLCDGSGREMAVTAANNPGLDVVLFVAQSQVENLSYALERYGIHVLGRNAAASEILSLLRVLRTAREGASRSRAFVSTTSIFSIPLSRIS